MLTPLEETSPEAIKRVTELWQACGARVSLMGASQHDKVLASVSHLPHVLAFTLMNHISTEHRPEDLLPSDNLPLQSGPLRFAGTGFRDFTRIAGSSPEMWRDICLANREALSRQIDAFQRELADVREMLVREDAEALEKVFANAREARREWLKSIT